MAKVKKEKTPLSISKCEICKGEPATSPLAITGMNPDFEGVKCQECFKIISYQKKI